MMTLSDLIEKHAQRIKAVTLGINMDAVRHDLQTFADEVIELQRARSGDGEQCGEYAE